MVRRDKVADLSLSQVNLLSQVDQSDRRKAVHLTYLQASIECATLNVSADLANSNSPLGPFP